jgi:hypothetical protein
VVWVPYWEVNKLTCQCKGNTNTSRRCLHNITGKFIKYVFINVNNKHVSLMCNVSADVGKKCNSERHFIITHKECISKYPDSRETHTSKVEDLKRSLW